jgi:DNA-binding MarR family transcriptional regulator
MAPRLDDDERALWRAFLAWTEATRGTISRELVASSDLTFPEFEVLIRLSDAGGRLDQRELSEALTWSPSRISHQLSRMESRGLIERTEVGSGRLMHVALTEAGTAAISAALDVHAESVRRHFLNRLSDTDRQDLGRIFVAGD